MILQIFTLTEVEHNRKTLQMCEEAIPLDPRLDKIMLGNYNNFNLGTK